MLLWSLLVVLCDSEIVLVARVEVVGCPSLFSDMACESGTWLEVTDRMLVWSLLVSDVVSEYVVLAWVEIELSSVVTPWLMEVVTGLAELLVRLEVAAARTEGHRVGWRTREENTSSGLQTSLTKRAWCRGRGQLPLLPHPAPLPSRAGHCSIPWSQQATSPDLASRPPTSLCCSPAGGPHPPQPRLGLATVAQSGRPSAWKATPQVWDSTDRAPLSL